MGTASAFYRGMAKKPGAKMGTSYAGTGITQHLIVNCLKALFPVKTWRILVDVLGVSERVAKHRMSSTREFSIDEMSALLHTEHGYKLVAAIMSKAEHQPKWWKLCAPLMEVAEAQEMQLRARQRVERVLKGALDADRDITSAIARAEAAAISVSQLHSNRANAFGPGGRAHDRAVAAANKK